MAKYKLMYFDCRALGEAIRWLLAYVDADWENQVVKWGGSEWEKIRPNTPTGFLPVLEIDGKQIPQSYAILRFLATEFQLTGNSKWEKVEVDVHMEHVRDMYALLWPIIGAKAEKNTDGVTVGMLKFTNAFPNFAARYDSLFGTQRHLVGDSLTVADLFLAEFLNRIQDIYIPDVLSKYSNLACYVMEIMKVPTLKSYLSKRGDFLRENDFY